MMSLLFLVFLVAMICVLTKKKSFAYALFTVGMLLSLFWLNHHATDPLSILL
ncbi:DUF5993 family protein [Vibrio rumoiensis]|uniref:DUF5993 family protein n=1 Tax=Vibrio rumoiensis TaxID=76258 RepID=UPI0002F3604C|nr:DUF5993 family protein [Vibrio rumoiensis]